ncbi:MAG: hypothetical protein A2583_13290 [Bdellovibrionales bacterium RIFOXYD1_FULL_53_11]|nr:MAG: hypothetical protein A2583_13290 [Bdellovibrionales bacterium RIFOXYD1_FULL_53_11]
MSASAQKPADKPGDKKAAVQVTPEAEASARIGMLQESVKNLEGELRTIEGRFKNRDPALIAPLQAENKRMQDRIDTLLKSYYFLLMESLMPRQSDEFKAQLEILKNSAIEYFKKANIDQEIWKNIVF